MTPAALTIFFWVLSIFAACVSFTNHWFLSKGKLNISYPLIIVACTCYIIVETILALRDPVQLGILVFNLTNLWAIIMATKGLMRLRKEEEENGRNNPK
jgi:uncharacterized membrane protein